MSDNINISTEKNQTKIRLNERINLIIPEFKKKLKIVIKTKHLPEEVPEHECYTPDLCIYCNEEAVRARDKAYDDAGTYIYCTKEDD